MIHTEDLIPIIRWLVAIVLAIDLGLTAYVFYRRLLRNRYFKRKDSALQKYASVVSDCISGDSQNEACLTLRRARRRAERDAICDLITDRLPSNQERATTLLMAFDFVKGWATTAFGRKRARQLVAHLKTGAELPHAPRHAFAGLRKLRVFAVPRSIAVSRLARLSPQFSQMFMMEALEDPSPLVARVTIIALGRNRQPGGAPTLLRELREAVNGTRQASIRTIKTALVRYPVSDIGHFLPYLRDENSRMRFLTVDTIREMCAQEEFRLEDFPAEVRDVMIASCVEDESPDVRARTAEVLRYFPGPTATDALRRLLDDPNEYVRLHAVRACATEQFALLSDAVLQRLNDSRWRVREAAVRTMASLGEEGVATLANHFVSTEDRYTAEQIAEDLQRSGAVATILDWLDDTDHQQLAGAVCHKLVAIDKTSLLIAALENHERFGVRDLLFALLADKPTPEFISAVRNISERHSDELRDVALDFLSESATAAAGNGDD